MSTADSPDSAAVAWPDSALSPSLTASSLLSVDPTDARILATDSPLPAPTMPRILPPTHARYDSLVSTLQSIASDCESELRDELKSKKVDVGAVRDLLRFHLARQIELAAEMEQIAKTERHADDASNDDAAPLTLPDSLLHAHPLISSGLRAQVWLLLLGCHNKDTTLLDGFDVEKLTVDPSTRSPSDEDGAIITPQLRENIHIDAVRTRGGMDQQPALVSEMEVLLVFYCHSRSVQYKQGLNEILAPLVMCMSTPPLANAASSAPVVPRGQIYNAFYALISKFLPSIFNDYDLENLRALFRLFRLLLVYHDPELGHFIEEESGVAPEIYATPWFLTLFAANGCDSMPTLQRVWDCVIVEDDPFLHYFIALALLRRHRALLLRTPPKSVPMVLRGLQIRSGDVLALVAEAKKLRSATPTSCRQTLFEISFAKKDLVQRLSASGSNGALHAAHTNASATTLIAPSTLASHLLEQFSIYASLLPCLSVPAAEIVQQAYSDLTGDGQIKYIVLDVRSAAEYSAGHLPCAIHISPSVLHIPSQLAALISEKQYGGMRECHFCFIGSQAASFHEVQTPVSSSHDLNLPDSRRAVPPPSPASSLAALAEAAKAEEHSLHMSKLLLDAVPIKDVSESAGGNTPVMGEEEARTTTQTASSPLSSNASESTNGVLYRPATPNGTDSSSPARSTSTPTSPSDTRTSSSSSVLQSSPLLDSALASFVAFFLRSGFAHLSICEGGFPAVHALVSAQQAAWKAQRAAIAAGETLPSFQAPLENMELVDHQPKMCHICTPALEAHATQKDKHAHRPSNSVDAHTTPTVTAVTTTSTTSSAASSTPPSPVPEAASSAKETSTADATHARTASSSSSSASSSGSKPSSSSSDQPRASSKSGSSSSSASDSVSDPKPSTLSKFSLGFKKLSLGFSDKLAHYKAEKAAAEAIKEKEREVARERDAMLKAAADKVAAERAAADKSAADKAAAEKSAAEKKNVKSTPDVVTASSNASDMYAAVAAGVPSAPDVPAPAPPKKVSSSSSSSSSKDVKDSKNSKDSSLGSRFLSAFGIKKKEAKVVAPTSESGAAVDLRDWDQDAAISLFRCHEISLLPVTRVTLASLAASNGPPLPVTPASPSTKRQGLLLPRVLAVTAGYVITFQPAKALTKRPEEVEDATSKEEPSPYGLAYLKAKHRLIDLDRITSKKDRPNVLTFHWKQPPDEIVPGSPQPASTPNGDSAAVASPSSLTPAITPARTKGPSTMFLVDHPKECIALVRAKFLVAKASAARAESNKQQATDHINYDDTANEESTTRSHAHVRLASTDSQVEDEEEEEDDDDTQEHESTSDAHQHDLVHEEQTPSPMEPTGAAPPITFAPIAAVATPPSPVRSYSPPPARVVSPPSVASPTSPTVKEDMGDLLDL